MHEVQVGEYFILDSVSYELATYTPADWVRLFETRFPLSVEHLRQRFPQETGSLLSLLARVWPCVWPVTLSETALESTPSGIGGSAWFLSCLVRVRFLLRGLAEGKASLDRSASLDACLLALPMPSVSGLFSGRVKLEASCWPSFSLLSLNLSTDVGTVSFVRSRFFKAPHVVRHVQDIGRVLILEMYARLTTQNRTDDGSEELTTADVSIDDTELKGSRRGNCSESAGDALLHECVTPHRVIECGESQGLQAPT